MNARLPLCRGLLPSLLLLNYVVLASGASQQKPSFRSGVELVLLDVSVLDAERRPVRGLAADDFTILEDGTPQTVASFRAVDLADVVTERSVTAPWVQAVAPDVTSNTDLKDRRIVAIVMDDATPMPAQEVPMAKAFARQVIDALGPNDLGCVVYALAKRSGQEFTTDRTRLSEAVDRFNGAIDAAGTDLKGQWWLWMPFDMYNVDNTASYLGTLRLVQSVARDLATLTNRRKALVLVSVGIPMDTAGPDVSTASSGNVGGSEALRDVWQSVQASLDAARQANVTIYGLDPGGLRGPGVYDRTSVQSTGRVRTADPTGLHPGRSNQEFLKTVSENTGGFAITDTNEPAPQIQQLLRENASYYLLGYAPTNTRALGRYRRIEIKVNRPGLTVRSRKGYFEADPSAAKKTKPVVASALSAMAGLLPKTDLPMSVAAAPYALPGQNNDALAIVVSVEFPAPKRRGRVGERFDLRVAAYAPTGECRAAIQHVMTVGVNASGAGGTVRFEQLARLDVPPGRYHVRAAATRLTEGATDAASGREGSVYTDVDAMGARAIESLETLGKERFGQARAADVRFDVPVAKLAPGRYLLCVETIAGKETQKREIRVVVKSR